MAIQSMGNIQIVFLLSFSHMGLQPNVAGVVDFYMKTFDLEILTTSYFIKKKSQINKQTLPVTKETMAVSCGPLATNIN